MIISSYSIKVWLLCSGISLLFSCASLVEGSKQEIAIQTVYNGSQVFGARCIIKNNEEEKSVTTPGIILIERSASYIEIICTKSDFPDGGIKAKSSAGSAVYGNILLGGIIGAGIDMGSGSAYDYENAIIVEMGKNIDLDDEKN